MSDLHQLMQDDDGHWYCVPVVYIDTFNAMMEGEWDEITKEGYEALDSWRVDGPHKVNFMLPVERSQASIESYNQGIEDAANAITNLHEPVKHRFVSYHLEHGAKYGLSSFVLKLKKQPTN